MAAAQRIVRDAFEDLEKTVSPADSDISEVTTLENVQNAAPEIENQCCSTAVLRNMRRLMPLFSGRRLLRADYRSPLQRHSLSAMDMGSY